MAANAYPGTPVVEEFKGGDSHAILVQVKAAYEHDVARVQDFVFDDAVAVGTASCSHDDRQEP
ncbi:unnamed protein product [Ectocarpus sp. CCAP 1310/34]|nr:unnamed protein product [Ectocarpus sp. CCAP 1310/34]